MAVRTLAFPSRERIASIRNQGFLLPSTGSPDYSVDLISRRSAVRFAYLPSRQTHRSRQVDLASARESLPRPRLQVIHGTVPQKCARNTLPAQSGILYRPRSTTEAIAMYSAVSPTFCETARRFALFYSHFHRHNRLSTLAEALAAKRLRLHTPTQDAVDLPKMVQVVCRFQADELLDRLPSAYLVDPITLHPLCARDPLQQSQVALAQRPKDPCRKARILPRVTEALRPCRLIPPC